MDQKPQKDYQKYISEISKELDSLFLSPGDMKNILLAEIEANHEKFDTLFKQLQSNLSPDSSEKIQAFLYNLIFQYLKKNKAPFANYYCDLAYNSYPEKDSNPYSENYVRSISSTSWNSIVKGLEMLEIFSQKVSPESEIEVLDIISKGKDFQAITKELNERSKTNSYANLELDLITMCYSARIFVSRAKKFTNILSRFEIFIRYLTDAAHDKYDEYPIQELPQIDSEKDFWHEFNKLINNLKELEKTHYSQELNLNTQTYNPISALKIYYFSLEQQHPEYELRIPYLLKSLIQGDLDSWYDIAKDHKFFCLKPDEIRSFASICKKYSIEQNKEAPEKYSLAELHGELSKKPEEYFFEMAAFNGNLKAQYDLAINYFKEENSKNLSEEEKETFRKRGEYFLRLSADNSYRPALFNLALKIKEGAIKAKDAESYDKHFISFARDIFLPRASKEDLDSLSEIAKEYVEAKMRLAVCYEKGYALEKPDTDMAQKLYSDLKNYPIALIRAKCIELGFLLQDNGLFELSDDRLVEKIEDYLEQIIKSEDISFDKKNELFNFFKDVIIPNLCSNTDQALPKATLNELQDLPRIYESLFSKNLKDFIEKELTGKVCSLSDRPDEILQILEEALMKKETCQNFLKLQKEIILSEELKDTKSAEHFKKDLKSFIYFIIFKNLAFKNRPEALYYSLLVGISYTNDPYFLEYYGARFSQDFLPANQKNRQSSKRILAGLLESGIQSPLLNKRSIELIDLASVRLSITAIPNFVEIIKICEKISGKYEGEEYIKSALIAEIKWLKFCDFAKNFAFEANNPTRELEKLLSKVNNIIYKQFDNPSQYFEEPKKPLTKDDEAILLKLLSDARESRADLANKYPGIQNLLSTDWTLELLRIVSLNEDEKMRYHLQSVEKNNPDSLFEFYNNYEKYCSEKYQKFFQDEPYKSMVAQPKKYFLELAALSGNIDAQYAFAEDLLLEVIALAEEITTEQDPQEKQLKENRLEILKKRREFFLENAAKNNHYEAQVKFAQSIELGYKKDNHSMPNCIIREDPGLAFYYYNKASKQNEAARKKVLEIVNSITSKDAKETTEKDFLFLKATFKYHPFLSLRYAICLESGYGTKQNKKLAAEIFETIDKNEGTDLYRRLLLATHYLSNNNSKLFKDLVGNTENGEALFAGIINLIKEQYIIALETKLDIFNNYCQKYHSVKDKNLQLITGVLNAIKTANDSSRKSLAKSSAIDFLETHAKPNPELPEEISKQCQEIILQLATSGIIKINPKEFKKFKDWRGENILKVLRLIYNAGIKIEKESERNKYIKEFQHHIQNNRDDENLIIKLKAENYPGNWIVDPKIEQQALEARRREEEEARRREEEARRKLAEEARIKEEKTRRKLAEEARIREEEARRREEEARRKLAEEARIREEEARRKADEEARAQEEEKARKQQMEEFLENRNPIESIKSLPEYVQRIITECNNEKQDFTDICITGSSSYGKKENPPTDLDIATNYKNLRNLTETEIQELVAKLLPFPNVKIEIFNQDSAFTVSVFYDKLQISIYDSNKPNLAPSWTSSIDAIRTGFEESGKAVKFHNPQLYDYYETFLQSELKRAKTTSEIDTAQRNIADFKKNGRKSDFFDDKLIINHEAKKFAVRSIMAVTKFQLQYPLDLLFQALQKAISQKITGKAGNVSSVILSDLGIKITKPEDLEKRDENKKRISALAKKHFPNPDLKMRFLENIVIIINSDFNLRDQSRRQITDTLLDAFDESKAKAPVKKSPTKRLPILDPEQPATASAASEASAASTTTTKPVASTLSTKLQQHRSRNPEQ